MSAASVRTQLILLQPTAFCNLNCNYCYLPDRQNSTLMSDEVLEAAIKCTVNSTLATNEEDSVDTTLLWHSGEPLVAKLAHYEKAVSYLKQYNIENKDIVLAIQTNAILLNQSWCDFFLENQFRIAVSIDGPEHIHNKNRVGWDNKGSFSKVMRGCELLKKNNMGLFCITVLTRSSLEHPNELYDFYKEHEFYRVGFNIDEIIGVNQRSSMKGSDTREQDEAIATYRHFMETFYQRWYDDGCPFQVREFDHLHQVIKMGPECIADHYNNLSSTPLSSVAIAADGDITTFSPELATGTLADPKAFVVGNILNIKQFSDLLPNHNLQQLYRDIFKGQELCAKECDYYAICQGGEPCDKFYEHGTFAASSTTDCTLSVRTLTDVVLKKVIENGSPTQQTL